MHNGVMVIQVRDGHVTLEQQFVYCWIHPHDLKIIYVGATRLHPAARAELHLNGLDENARIVGTHLADSGIQPDEQMQVLAFPVADELDRQQVRLALIYRLAQVQMLSDTYFGPAPGMQGETPDPACAVWVENAVNTLKMHLHS